MARNTSDTPRARALGAELRRLRNQSGMSVRDFGKHVGLPYVRISRAETGRKPPTAEDVATILGALGVAGSERERLLDMARAALDPTWVAPGVDKQLQALIDFEADATTITDVAPLLVPGLLQTENYARAIMSDGVMTAGEIQAAVTTRLGRQNILLREKPIQFVALIGAPVLRHPFGGREVMAEQLRHIAKQAELPNVTVQAIPVSETWEPSLAGPFVLYEFPLAEPVVHVEHYRSSMFLPDKKDVEDMRKAADTIRERAMSPEETSGLITNVIDEMEYTT